MVFPSSLALLCGHHLYCIVTGTDPYAYCACTYMYNDDDTCNSKRSIRAGLEVKTTPARECKATRGSPSQTDVADLASCPKRPTHLWFCRGLEVWNDGCGIDSPSCTICIRFDLPLASTNRNGIILASVSHSRGPRRRAAAPVSANDNIFSTITVFLAGAPFTLLAVLAWTRRRGIARGKAITDECNRGGATTGWVLRVKRRA